MALNPGSHLGPYEIVAPLGAGGMGEVYRARDSRLERDVAIKVLPDHLTTHDEARSRFEREAKAVAALSHPNILAIHDVGEDNGVTYAVTEFLSGDTLAGRLQSGPLPPRKAVEIARHIAEGLAAAHDAGIVHRDLKPDNIFITDDGRVKILDFGLAKATLLGGGQSVVATVAATVAQATDPGTVLGTVGYMSPEQVRAQPVDHRSDIFSLGVVLFEMLTRTKPFLRDSAVETMNAILHDDPGEISTTDRAMPAGLERILSRCLEKRPAERFQSARDLAFALANTEPSSGRRMETVEEAAPRRRIGAGRALVSVTLVVLGGVLGALIYSRMAPPTVLEPVKVETLTYSGRDWSPSASPDGKTVAFTSERDGRQRIWLRQMAGGMEVALTDGPDYFPSFSPDGSSILFIHEEGRQRSVYRVSAVGGQPRKVLDDAIEACWSPDGERIAFVRAPEGEPSEGVLGVADVQTGQERELVRLRDQVPYGAAWSPSGRKISAAVRPWLLNSPETYFILVDPETGESSKVFRTEVKVTAPVWTGSENRVIYGKTSSLLGGVSSSLSSVVSLDLRDGQEHVLFWVHNVYHGGDFSRFDVLGAGRLVFDELFGQQNLVEVSADEAGEYGPPRFLTRGNGRDRQPAYSPDGSRIIFSSARSGNLDLWILDTVNGEIRQITDDDAEDWDPAFTYDGRGVLWSSNRGGHLEIWTAAVDGSGARQLTRDGRDAENPTQTSDGAWIIYSSGNLEKVGIWKIRSDGSEATRLDAGAYLLPEVSPDDKYVLYAAPDLSRSLGFLHAVDLETGKRVFSTEVEFTGGRIDLALGRCRWMPGGRAFVFVAQDESGRWGLYAQDFMPGKDTASTRRPIIGFSSEYDIESFGISPDGALITMSNFETIRSLKVAEGVPGVQ